MKEKVMPRRAKSEIKNAEADVYRNAHTVWFDVLRAGGPSPNWEPSNRVANKLIAQYFAHHPDKCKSIIDRLVSRVANTPVAGQYGVKAKEDLSKGTVFAFPLKSFSMDDRPTIRRLSIERNTFTHPIRGRPHFTVDTKRHSILRSINSAWNGLPEGQGGRVIKTNLNVSLGVFPAEEVVLCYVLKKIRAGTELRLGYKWYADDTHYD